MPYIKAFSFIEHICVYAWALERHKLAQKQQRGSFSGRRHMLRRVQECEIVTH